MSERRLFEDSLRDTLYDIFNLETNTIICTEITARHMPATMHAVLDIAHAYREFLAEKGMPDVDLPARVTTGPRTFLALANAARTLLGAGASLSAADRGVVTRIRRSSIHLCFVLLRIAGVLERQPRTDSEMREADLQKLAALVDGMELFNAVRAELYDLQYRGKLDAQQLRPQDRSTIRKIWEIRCQHVALQSVIQLDGDVLTRVQESYAGPQYDWLHDLHRRGVGTSIGMWSHLVDTLRALAQGLARGLLGVLRP